MWRKFDTPQMILDNDAGIDIVLILPDSADYGIFGKLTCDMKCEICHKGDAKAAIHKMVDGKDTELYVCEECARREMRPAIEVSDESGNVLGQIDVKELEQKLSNALFGAIFSMAGKDLLDMTEPKCPRCGLPRSEFRKEGRLGCPACYKAFQNEVEPMIRDMHRGTVHVGKVPSAVARDREASRVAAQLRAAIEEQRFEDAAKLRNRLDELRPKSGYRPARRDAKRNAGDGGTGGAGGDSAGGESC